ncbi:Aliphatic amidase AmiE [hydrothermal vent metagenome]|uniref:Aliphatic amidase AmiE n=1 Tax=hydrothermal vent metagenome TaxID=652676 RepID=A0A1W1BUZ2_9ZZZZ
MSGKSKTLEAVILQLPTHLRYQENLDTLLHALKKYSQKQIVVAPEVFLTGYDYAHLKTAAKFSANALKTLKKEIDKQILVLTLILEDGDGFVNQAVVIHKHKVIHKQEKLKLFKLGDEDLYLKAGKKKKIKPFEIDGVRYAMLICFELRFKELWKQIEGAEVVFVPARWGKPRKKHLEVLSEALAVMNQSYLLLSNSSDSDMASSSAIISPTGEVIRDDEKEVIEGTIDFREIKKMRRYIAMDWGE